VQRLGVEVVPVRQRLRIPVREGLQQVQRVVAGTVIEVAVVVFGEGGRLLDLLVFLVNGLHQHSPSISSLASTLQTAGYVSSQPIN
jgi:hypothetical protein